MAEAPGRVVAALASGPAALYVALAVILFAVLLGTAALIGDRLAKRWWSVR